jgi:hypothetical protein
VQIEPRLHIAKVMAGYVMHSGQPVAQGAAVDAEPLGGLFITATELQVHAERVHEVGMFFGVVINERAQPFTDEVLNRLRFSSVDQPVEAQFVVGGRSGGRGRAVPNIKCAPSSVEGFRKIT